MIEINLIISSSVRTKLKDKHNVTEDEIKECFVNKPKGKGQLLDNRADHKTNPKTMWFISETDRERKLKIAWMKMKDGAVIKSAFEPNETEIGIYERHA